MLGIIFLAVGIGTGGWIISKGNGGPRPDLLLHKVQFEKLQRDDRRARCPRVGRERATSSAASRPASRAASPRPSAGSSMPAPRSRPATSSSSWMTRPAGPAQEPEDHRGHRRGQLDQGREDYKIQLEQNTSDIATAKLDLDMAASPCSNYLEGTYAQASATLRATSDDGPVGPGDVGGTLGVVRPACPARAAVTSPRPRPSPTPPAGSAPRSS